MGLRLVRWIEAMQAMKTAIDETTAYDESITSMRSNNGVLLQLLALFDELRQIGLEQACAHLETTESRYKALNAKVRDSKTAFADDRAPAILERNATRKQLIVAIADSAPILSTFRRVLLQTNNAFRTYMKSMMSKTVSSSSSSTTATSTTNTTSSSSSSASAPSQSLPNSMDALIAELVDILPTDANERLPMSISCDVVDSNSIDDANSYVSISTQLHATAQQLAHWLGDCATAIASHRTALHAAAATANARIESVLGVSQRVALGDFAHLNASLVDSLSAA